MSLADPVRGQSDCLAGLQAVLWEQTDIEIAERADSGDLVHLVGVNFAEKWPEKLTALGHKFSQAHVVGYVPCVRLHVIRQAADVAAYAEGVV